VTFTTDRRSGQRWTSGGAVDISDCGVSVIAAPDTNLQTYSLTYLHIGLRALIDVFLTCGLKSHDSVTFTRHWLMNFV